MLTPSWSARFTDWFVFDDAAASLVGVHRVQRVPASEKRGRRHTSEVVVALVADVAPVAGGLDVRETWFRASGPGGQHRNKVESAVRLHDRRTGVVVTATEERSQRRNREVAYRRLARAVDELDRSRQLQDVNEVRSSAFEGSAAYLWCGWRDRVDGPHGSTSMRRALRGYLAPLLP